MAAAAVAAISPKRQNNLRKGLAIAGPFFGGNSKSGTRATSNFGRAISVVGKGISLGS